MKITASGPITSWQIDRETMERVRDFIFLGSKITVDGDCHEITRHLLLGRKAMTKLDSILKSRDITLLTKVHLVKAMVLPVFMWELADKENWAAKNWWFWTVVLEKTLWESLGLQGDPMSPKYSLEGLMLKCQYFGHLMWRTDSLEKTLMLGKTEGRRRRGRQRMRWLDGITNSMVWVWASSGSWWWTWKPGVLQSMGSQSIGHDWVTVLNCISFNSSEKINI